MDIRAVRCEPHFTAAGLPQRAPLLDRERGSYEVLAQRLAGAGRGSSAQAPVLTVGMLERGLESDDPSHPWIAAFLIGRCRATEPEADAHLSRVLEASIQGPRPESILVVEVGMSLVMRGQRDEGLALLRRVLDDPSPFGHQYTAAYYLAQTGDPSGYPALVRAAQATSNQSRIMAVRHAIAFMPYNGTRVGDTVVDVRQLLMDRLGDAQPIVRREVPFYLEELGIPDLVEVLEPIRQNDPDSAVRAAAQAAIDKHAQR